MVFVQQLINGLTIGSVYALVAIGLSLIWATASLLDFAFGQVFMLGGVLSWTFMVLGGMPLPLAMLLAVVIAAALGFCMERFLYARLYNADHVILLIATIGAAMILEDGATKIWGAEVLVFPASFSGVWLLGPFFIRIQYVFIMLTTAGLIAVLHVALTRSRTGVALRAVAENRNVAAMMGVNVLRMLGLGFAASYFLAAAAGALIGPIFDVATTGGTSMMVKGVTAAVLGGFGSLPGALVGGLTIGVVEALSAGYVSSAFKDLIVFGAFVGLLLVRPQGLLGERRMGVSDL
jgi:branched-chain amino acid transport system permease protein